MFYFFKIISKDSTVFVWGDNDKGSLGTKDIKQKFSRHEFQKIKKTLSENEENNILQVCANEENCAVLTSKKKLKNKKIKNKKK